VTTYRTQAADTSPEAERVQIEIWRRMTPAEKFAVFAALQRDVELLAEAGIRRRHPEATDREVFLRRIALDRDRATMIRVFGWDPEGAG
jgi:hypothetical protein